ncbi:hypothetical protein FHS21_001492 [Phyllobacterium trifolii]|uniref:Uncharacterized protein n=1 Tax=Phyllobacterium trifolii TaxID=300193 RepID=A0A839U3Q0_9HYPH|nr:hypothetical protein [Phyllobacterium trifolii]MBB3145087.1 hypothetical protein [Phyllobacterium trifolii]
MIPKTNPGRVLGGAFVALIAALLLPAVLGDKTSDRWVRFIYDYQTLLTSS